MDLCNKMQLRHGGHDHVCKCVSQRAINVMNVK